MAQTVNLDIRAGISKTGVAFGAAIYQLDSTTLYAAFSTAGWYEEPAGSGSYHNPGVAFPDAGGVVKYGVSGTIYNTFSVEQVKATPTNITAGTITTVTNLTNAPANGDLTTAMKASVTAAVPTSSAIATAVWDALTSALTTVGSIGKLIVTNLDAAISSRMATFSYTTPPTAVQNRQEMDTNSTQLAKLGTPANVSVSDDIAALLVQILAILDDTGTTGVVLSAANKQAIADEKDEAEEGRVVGV